MLLRNLGVQFREVGNFAEARDCFERALQFDSLDGRAHRYLLEIQDAGSPEFAAHLDQIAGLLDNAELTDENRVDLHFALGGGLDHLSRYDEALVQFREGNRLRRATLVYDHTQEVTRFVLLQRMFNRTIARVAAAGPPDERPVFVFGMPRSGTTLVESLLAPHPLVRALGELTAFERSINHMRPIQADPRDHDTFLSELRAEIAQVGERYLGEIDPEAGATQRNIDKLPANFRYAVTIHLALPSAKLVHVRRDPFDTCFSCFATNFLESQEFTFDVAEVGRYFALYLRHMEYVRAILPPGVMLELDYEEIVGDVERAARRLLAHCGLEWDARVLSFWEHERPIRTASVVQARRPIYTSSVGRAKRYPAFCEELATAMTAAV